MRYGCVRAGKWRGYSAIFFQGFTLDRLIGIRAIFRVFSEREIFYRMYMARLKVVSLVWRIFHCLLLTTSVLAYMQHLRVVF